MDLVPERPFGRGRKPDFLRPGGLSGPWAQEVRMKSRSMRTVVRFKRGLGLARMPVKNGPAGNPGSLDPSVSIIHDNA
jgi:hypothetical protein